MADKQPPDVPDQYRALIHREMFRMVDAAHALWPVVRELGETFECEHDGIKIIVSAAGESATS